ncbi:hypothetical protein CRI84_10700 [Liquorilactobacillus hordei]|nr:hypothetical protein [Liquorilactobacillus hordei]
MWRIMLYFCAVEFLVLEACCGLETCSKNTKNGKEDFPLLENCVLSFLRPSLVTCSLIMFVLANNLQGLLR